MAIILVLAGLILSISSYVQNKGARSRAEAEIAAMSAALESYKADNGIYPRSSGVTEPTTPTGSQGLSATNHGDPTAAVYTSASFFVYGELSGDRDGNRSITSADRRSGETADPRSYFAFKTQMLSPIGGTGTVTAVRDPFGNSYGYSTANQVNNSRGYNPTFDLWSTAGTSDASTIPPSTTQWIKNW